MRVLILLLLLLPDLARAQAPADPSPPDPALGMNLAGIADWSTEHPFLDLMRTARPWIGHEAGDGPGAWGAWDAARLREGGFVGADGWPRALPPGVVALETFVLTDQPEEAVSLAGTYLLRWEGTAEVSPGGRARDVRRVPGGLAFRFEPGEGPVGIRVAGLDPADPLRSMTLVREDRVALWEAGALFDPAFLDRVRGFRSFRFMDWMATNGSGIAEWEERPREGDFTWAGRGVPVEVLVRLANEAGADPWFTLPHMASDAYVRAFAGAVRDRLDPRLRVYAEWSNEVWNWIFPQAAWARDRAVERWGADAPGDAWMQWAGLRGSQVAGLWAEAFADEPGRLVRVVAVQTGWPGLEDALLDAPLVRAEGLPAPSEAFDAYAVTGYFGQALGGEEGAPALRAAIAEGRGEAFADEVAGAELDALLEDLWPRHAAAAARRGLRLVAYEAGPHAVGQGALGEDEAVTAFLTAWSYSPGLAALQARMIEGWEGLGGTLLAPFVDAARPSRWGSWGALRHPDDRNPRWDTLVAANARAPAWDEGRDPAGFADGAVVAGTEGPDALEGTPEEDAILAGGGDDAVTVRGADAVDGGEGLDMAVLPGARAEWAPGREGERLTLARGWVTVRLRGVEVVRFDDGEARAADVLAEAAP